MINKVNQKKLLFKKKNYIK